MLDILRHTAIEAGQAILVIYRKGAEIGWKADCSPVTDADCEAERIILAALTTAFPDIPVIAEESVAAGCIPDISGGTFFLVDPLDGTREFIGRHDDFTVNIALIENGKPVLGVIYAPALGLLYTGAGGRAEKMLVGEDGQEKPAILIGCRNRGDRIVAVASRSHNSEATVAYLHEHGLQDFQAVGSSLKFCLLAEGVADIYPRFSRTMEWDTAAGDAILRAAGGETLTMEGVPLTYGKRGLPHDADFANPFFVSRGRS
ncbi:3'(2'),5'-bisphosphate nucleotidase [Rhizobium sp. RU20A]|uniref:3'(2'),5'-bisphosphate nucleotidase CysQ n=1 Tax=Rhizobium sp. RU20A TaxID=1907412 RepID=UPI000954A896|nr:3'(2'),5'-bisphosphate nucleotidase CysQ [Rhizobium sp. RU20A]SIQ33375.1 3'(2'),5'-bisphosphate nucleotidase [Rhizobium sp. RU20A]